MKDIKRLSIQNFRTHERSDIEIAPGITAFVGESAHGKTNIIRFLKWVLKNAPDGVGMIRRGETRAKGTIEFEDGTEVTRERSSSINRYSVVNPDGEMLSFNNFGRAVPPEVLEASGYSEVRIDGTTRLPIHFSDQLEGPFLVSLSNGDKGRVIDGLAKINKISMAMAATKRESKDISTERNISVTEQTRLNKQLENYEQLDEQMEAVDQALAKLQEAQAVEAELERLRYLQGRLTRLSTELVETERLITSLTGVVESDRFLGQATLCGTQSDLFRRMVLRWKHTEDELNLIRPILATEQQILTAATILNDVTELTYDIQDIRNLRDDYADVLKAKNAAEPFLARLRAVNDASVQFDEVSALDRQIQMHQSLKQRHVLKASELQTLSVTLQELQHLSDADALLQGMSENERLLHRLKTIQTNHHTIRTNLQRGENFLRSLDGLDDVSRKMIEQEQLLSQMAQLDALRRQHLSVTTEMTQVHVANGQLEESLEQDKQSYTEALRSLKVCPICSSTMDEQHLHQAYESL